MLVVIAGFGNVGRHLLRKFADYNANIIIIENDVSKIERIKQQHDVLVKSGNMLSHYVLRGANIGASDFFIACSDSDGDNIVACQLAERMGAKTTVARIYSEEIFPYDINELEDYLNVDWLISPSRLSGYNLAFYLHQNEDIVLDNYFSNQMDVAKLTISKKCTILNKKSYKIFKHHDVSVVAYCRDGHWLLGEPEDVLKEGDQIILIGIFQRVMMLLLELYPDVYKKNEKIYIAGCSNSSLFMISLLQGKKNITLFEQDEELCNKIQSKYEIKVINLDPSDFHQLKEYQPNIDGVFICASINDADNLTYALNAEDLGFQTIIPIVNENDKVRLFKRFNFSHYISPPYLSSQEIFRCFSQTMMQDFELIKDVPIYSIVKEVKEDSASKGEELPAVMGSDENSDGILKAIAIRRKGEVLLVDEHFLKNAKTNKLQVGDRVLIISKSDDHKKLLKAI